MRSNGTWTLALSSWLLTSCGSSPDSGGSLPVTTGAPTTAETIARAEPTSSVSATVIAPSPPPKFAISLHDTKGKLKSRFDQKKEDAGLCFAKRVTPCAAGVCVLDTNCRKIAAWSAQGKFIGQVSFSPLLGVSNPLPQDMWIAQDEAYVVINAEAKSKDGNHVVLFRVLGL